MRAIFAALIAASRAAAQEPDLDCLPLIGAPPGFQWPKTRTADDNTRARLEQMNRRFVDRVARAISAGREHRPPVAGPRTRLDQR